MDLIDSLKLQKYYISSSAKHFYCNACVEKLYYRPAYYCINHESKTVTMYCQSCRELIKISDLTKVEVKEVIEGMEPREDATDQ